MYQDRTGLYWTFNDSDYATAQKISTSASAALVFLQSDSGEYYIGVDGNQGDRNNLTAWFGGNQLVQEVASVNNNTIVVVQSGAQLDLESFVEHPNVTAIVWAGFPGSEAGNALADILYGRVNPSGRIPFTIAKNRSDYNVDVVYKSNATHTPITYHEGLHVDYRWFDAPGSPEPRYSFGHGLSYTSFDYKHAKGGFIDDQKPFDTSKTDEVYPEKLFAPIYRFSFEVTNNGTSDGFEVPQAYLAFPKNAGEPAKVLRKFDRFEIKQNETKTISFELNTYDLSIWNTTQQKWVVPQGETKLLIGAGSRDIRLTLPVN